MSETAGPVAVEPPDQPAAEPTAAVSPLMERVTAGVVIVFGIFLLVTARSIELRNETDGIDPRWWPTVISAGIIGSGLWMLVNAVLGVSIERSVEPSRRSGWIQVGITVGALVAVLVLWQMGVSFLVLGPAFLIVTNWAYGLRRWTTLLLFPAIVTLILYLVFQLLLKVPL